MDFLHAFLGLIAYDLACALCPFRVVYALVRDCETRLSASGQPSPHVLKAVNLACIWYPKQVLCLQRACVTTYLLRRHGIPARMVIGAQKLPFRAHAWVEVEGRVINERSHPNDTYQVWDRC